MLATAAAEGADALVFPVRGERHALLVTTVREVVPAAPVSPVPAGPAWLLGVANIRGDVVAVVDTGATLADQPTEASTHLVLAESSGGPVALAAGGPPWRQALGERATTTPGPAGFVCCFATDDGIVTLLDVDALTGQRAGGPP